MSKATDKAYSLIRDCILDGTFPAGSHLKEGELVERCGVSRTPVRDALKLLAIERYVVTRRNQGVFVNDWSLEDVKDIFAMRAMLEALVARYAAENAEPEQLVKLSRIHTNIETMLDRLETPDIDYYLEQNNQFHRILIEMANRRAIADTIGHILQPPLIVHTARRYTKAGLRQSNDHHREIIDALSARDGAWAESAMRTHILAAQRKFLVRYNQSNGQPA